MLGHAAGRLLPLGSHLLRTTGCYLPVIANEPSVHVFYALALRFYGVVEEPAWAGDVAGIASSNGRFARRLDRRLPLVVRITREEGKERETTMGWKGLGWFWHALNGRKDI